MAEAHNTLAGLIQFNDNNLADLMVTDLLEDAPLLQVMTAVPASNGTQHKYLKQTTASSSAFRAVGGGLTKTPSQDTLVTDTLKILDGSYYVDKALADAYKGGADAYLEIELIRTMKQRMFMLEKQILQGTNSDANGFAGLQDDAQLDALADTMVEQPKNPGTGSDQTSVYILRTTEDDVAAVLGNDGMFDVSEDPIVQAVYNNAAALTTYPAYFVAVCGYAGFQIGSAYSAARLCNIDTGDISANDALTDDDIYKCLANFPAGKQPNVIAMNRKALALLRNSRTAVNATGAPAPRPTEVEGIPIVVTDGIESTESVVS